MVPVTGHGFFSILHVFEPSLKLRLKIFTVLEPVITHAVMLHSRGKVIFAILDASVNR